MVFLTAGLYCRIALEGKSNGLLVNIVLLNGPCAIQIPASSSVDKSASIRVKNDSLVVGFESVYEDLGPTLA